MREDDTQLLADHLILEDTEQLMWWESADLGVIPGVTTESVALVPCFCSPQERGVPYSRWQIPGTIPLHSLKALGNPRAVRLLTPRVPE